MGSAEFPSEPDGLPLVQWFGRLMVWISATGRSMVVVVVRASRVPLVPLVEVQVMS